MATTIDQEAPTAGTLLAEAETRACDKGICLVAEKTLIPTGSKTLHRVLTEVTTQIDLLCETVTCPKEVADLVVLLPISVSQEEALIEETRRIITAWVSLATKEAILVT